MTATPLALLLLFAPPDWVDRARSAPPEFAAHLLLKAAAQETNRAARIELIDEAYRFAGRAAEPWPVVAAARSDTLAGRRSQARDQHLDALSLQVRAIQAMLNVHPARAVEMALALPVPSPARTACKEAAVPHIGEYYGVVLTIAGRGFTAKQKEEGRHLAYALGVVAASTSPEQIAGAVALVRAFPAADNSERLALASTLAAALQAAGPSPRDYSLTPGLVSSLNQLRKDIPLPDLDHAVEAYIKMQTDAEPCLEPENNLFFATGEARQIQQGIMKLRGTSGDTDRDWEIRFKALLSQIDSWREETGASEAALFHARALFYQEMLDLSSTDEHLTAVLSSFIPFLRDAPAKTSSPAEWMMYFRRALAPYAPAGPRATAIAIDQVRRSGDLLMNLLADAGETR